MADWPDWALKTRRPDTWRGWRVGLLLYSALPPAGPIHLRSSETGHTNKGDMFKSRVDILSLLIFTHKLPYTTTRNGCVIGLRWIMNDFDQWKAISIGLSSNTFRGIDAPALLINNRHSLTAAAVHVRRSPEQNIRTKQWPARIF